jgi:hypothetical protein
MTGRPMINASSMRKIPMKRRIKKYMSRCLEKLCKASTLPLTPEVTAELTPCTCEAVAEPASCIPVEVACMPCAAVSNIIHFTSRQHYIYKDAAV